MKRIQDARNRTMYKYFGYKQRRTMNTVHESDHVVSRNTKAPYIGSMDSPEFLTDPAVWEGQGGAVIEIGDKVALSSSPKKLHGEMLGITGFRKAVIMLAEGGINEYGHDDLVLFAKANKTAEDSFVPGATDNPEVKKESVQEAVKVIPYTREFDKKLKNVEALPHGLHARYLLVIQGLDDEWVAKQWLRKLPSTVSSIEAVVDMQPKESVQEERGLTPKEEVEALYNDLSNFLWPTVADDYYGRDALYPRGDIEGHTYNMLRDWHDKADTWLDGRLEGKDLRNLVADYPAIRKLTDESIQKYGMPKPRKHTSEEVSDYALVKSFTVRKSGDGWHITGLMPRDIYPKLRKDPKVAALLTKSFDYSDDAHDEGQALFPNATVSVHEEAEDKDAADLKAKGFKFRVDFDPKEKKEPAYAKSKPEADKLVQGKKNYKVSSMESVEVGPASVKGFTVKGGKDGYMIIGINPYEINAEIRKDPKVAELLNTKFEYSDEAHDAGLAMFPNAVVMVVESDSSANTISEETVTPESLNADESGLMDELVLYIDNDYDVYKRRDAYAANVIRKMAAGNYNPDLAPKLWINYVEIGAQKYTSEFEVGPDGEPKTHGKFGVFSPKVRRAAGYHYAREFEREVEENPMSQYTLKHVPKKYMKDWEAKHGKQKESVTAARLHNLFAETLNRS